MSAGSHGKSARIHDCNEGNETRQHSFIVADTMPNGSLAMQRLLVYLLPLICQRYRMPFCMRVVQLNITIMNDHPRTVVGIRVDLTDMPVPTGRTVSPASRRLFPAWPRRAGQQTAKT